MLIINAKIYTLEGKIIEQGYVNTFGNRIVDVGDMNDLGGYDCQFFDVGGQVICPGFIDIHTHLGIIEDSLCFEGDDANEDTDPVTPELRAIDAINPYDKAFLESVRSGVTSVVVSAGSANPIAGQMVLLKTAGNCIDEMIVDPYVAMKFALGENPKSVYNSKNQTPATRMATTALIRESLFKTQQYMQKKEEDEMPDFEMKYEALIPVLKREVQAHFHAHRADDIFTAIRIANEFDLDLVLVHATEAYMVADKVRDIPMIIGPFLTDRSKPELANLSLEAPKILAENDVLFSISTDHPETPLKFLDLCASVAIREGLSFEKALECITINPAKIIGADDKIGSIKKGKHADLVILSGEPFQNSTKVTYTMINGVLKSCEK